VSRRGPARRLACLAGATVIGAYLVVAGSARAATGLATGWWWSGQSNGLTPKQDVPDGGLWVAGDPSGTQAESAVQFQLQPGESSPVLTLTIHQTQSANPAVIACPAGSPWQPAAGGPWAQRPQPNCSGAQAAGKPSPDGKKLSFDLGPLASQSGLVSVVLIPQSLGGGSGVALPSSVNAPSSTVDVTFERIDPSALAVTTPPPAPAPAPESAPVATPTTAFENALQQQSSPFSLSAPAESAPALPAPSTPSLSAPSAAPAPRGTASFPSGGNFAPQNTSVIHHLSRAERAILDVALLVLLYETFVPGSALFPVTLSATRRRRLTLYDDPSFVDPEQAVAPARPGEPPPLR